MGRIGKDFTEYQMVIFCLPVVGFQGMTGPGKEWTSVPVICIHRIHLFALKSGVSGRKIAVSIDKGLQGQTHVDEKTEFSSRLERRHFSSEPT